MQAIYDGLTYVDYQKHLRERQMIISENRSRQMRVPAQSPLPVPAKLSPARFLVAYSSDGDYIGVITDTFDRETLPKDTKFKWEIATW